MISENNGKEKKSGENSSEQVDFPKNNSSSSGQSNSDKERKQKIFKDSLEKASSSLILTQKKIIVDMEPKK
jgi:hypothetical protein